MNSKTINIILAILLGIVVFIKMPSCNESNQVPVEIGQSEKRSDSLELLFSGYQDSVASIQREIDTVYLEIEVARKSSNKKIEQAKKVTESEGDSLFDLRFDSKKDAFIFSVVADSVTLELSNINRLFSKSYKKNQLQDSSIMVLKSNLNEKDFQLNVLKSNLNIIRSDLKKEKKKKWVWAIGGVVVGLAASNFTNK